MGLLPSKGNMALLTFVAVHFVLLPKIPCALETSNLLDLDI